MLALIKDNPVLNRVEILGQFSEGGWVDLPDGSRVSPAVDGWSLRGYQLKAITPADPVPAGQVVSSSSIQMVNGSPKVVNVLAPVAVTVEDYEDAIQSLVDTTAREKQFRDGVTMASYVASTNGQWAAEAQAFVAWRDCVWAHAYAELAKVQAGEREQPTIEEFLSEIEPIVWPAA